MNEIMSHRQENMAVQSLESVVGKQINSSFYPDTCATKEETLSNNPVDETDYENESVKSVDITNMLKKVMMGSLDDDNDDTIISNIVYDVQNDVMDNNPNIISIEEIEDENDNEEDIVISKTQTSNEKDVLLKKTNEELKTMLKNKSLSTKGSKAELVDRLITSNM